MNKKKIFGFIAVLVIAAGAVWNVSLISKNNSLSDISLKGIDSHANIIEDIGNWWSSKVYRCELINCFNEWVVGGFIVYTSGTGMNCISGSAYAHCWECETSCNAPDPRI
jgi:hypothetical protein